MKIEAGKFYRTRDNEIVGPMVARQCATEYKFKGQYKGCWMSWLSDGQFDIDRPGHARDLISDMTDQRIQPHEAEERFKWDKRPTDAEFQDMKDRFGGVIDLAEVIRSADIRNGIDATLAERGTRYGAFTEHARITQGIKRAMQDSPNWDALADDQREALEMIAHKAGRILNGDPDYHDSWHDIVGYTKLVADRLEPTSN